MEKKRGSRNRSTFKNLIDFQQKAPKQFNEERKEFSINGAGRLAIHLGQGGSRSSSHSVNKDNFKMDHRPRASRRKYTRICLGLVSRQILF